MKIQLLLCCLLVSPVAWCAQWSTTELHWQHGKQQAPQFAGGETANTRILTLQHASGWQYGDNFFFADFIGDDNNDGYNDSSAYMELYAALSLNKLRNKKRGEGLLADWSLVAGINHNPQAKVTKFLPGLRFDFNAPGFNFLKLSLTAYQDHNKGVNRGGAPKEDNSYMLDIAFSRTWQLSTRHHFSLEGHAEYIGQRNNAFREKVSAWILAQPQIRYDMGNLLWQQPEQLYLGIEYQYWQNKLGDANTNESEMLLLVVWRL